MTNDQDQSGTRPAIVCCFVPFYVLCCVLAQASNNLNLSEQGTGSAIVAVGIVFGVPGCCVLTSWVYGVCSNVVLLLPLSFVRFLLRLFYVVCVVAMAVRCVIWCCLVCVCFACCFFVVFMWCLLGRRAAY